MAKFFSCYNIYMKFESQANEKEPLTAEQCQQALDDQLDAIQAELTRESVGDSLNDRAFANLKGGWGRHVFTPNFNLLAEAIETDDRPEKDSVMSFEPGSHTGPAFYLAPDRVKGSKIIPNVKWKHSASQKGITGNASFGSN